MIAKIYQASKDGLKKASSLFEERFPGTHKYVSKNKRRIFIVLPIVLIILFFVLKPKGIDPKTITVAPVLNQDLVSTVKASGAVTSIVDLNLSFQTSDVVRSISATVGQKVRKGQQLATLELGNESAAVKQALGGLKSAQATLQKTQEGATSQELKVAQTAYDNALRDYEKTKANQDALVENARRVLYSQYLEAISDASASTNAPTIYGVYLGSVEGAYKISTYQTGSGSFYSVTGLGTSSGSIDIGVPKPLGNEGLYVTFPSGFATSLVGWTVSVPNKASAYYTANSNAYISAVQVRDLTLSQARSVVDARKADLELKQAGARTADLDIAEANVLVAEGVYQNALANLEKKILRAPADGTVTRVDIKIGELAKALEPIIVVQDVSKLYIEADINESNITNLLVGQPAKITIDAFGPERIFAGTVTEVEPSATITDGIVNYKIKVSIDENEVNIRPGMNANITVTTGTKQNVLVVPGAAIFKKDGKSFVNLITDKDSKKYTEREVVTGVIGDGNLTEISNGLSVGDQVAIVPKK